MDISLEEYKDSFRFKNKGTKNKIRNSWGVYDYFKYYRVHRPNEHKYVLYECVYFSIIRKVNKKLGEELCRTGRITFPWNMGGLEVFTKNFKTKVYNNKLYTNKLVDWGKTFELWYEDEQCRNMKTLVYRDAKDIPLIKYVKTNAYYKNKAFYNFKVGRELRDKIIEASHKDRFKSNLTFEFAELSQIKGLYDD